MKYFDLYRAHRAFGTKAIGKGIIVVYNGWSEGFFHGWTMRVVANNRDVLSSFAQPSLRSAVKELRYKLHAVRQLRSLKRKRHWVDRDARGSVHIAEYSSTTSTGERWWIRKTFYAYVGERCELRIRIEYAHRNDKAQFQKRKGHSPVEFTVFGKTPKDVRTTLKAFRDMVGF